MDLLEFIQYAIVLLWAIGWYKDGTKVISEKIQYGTRNNGPFSRSTPMVRKGDDAVAVGKAERIFGTVMVIVVVTDLLGLHNLTFIVFFILLMILFFVIWSIYPMEPVTKESPSVSEDNQPE